MPIGRRAASTTDINVKLTERLRRIKLPGVEVFVESVKEHRFVLVCARRAAAEPAWPRGCPKRIRRRSASRRSPFKALNPRAKAPPRSSIAFVAEARRLLADRRPRTWCSWPASTSSEAPAVPRSLRAPQRRDRGARRGRSVLLHRLDETRRRQLDPRRRLVSASR